jgi:hypothetical protein
MAWWLIIGAATLTLLALARWRRYAEPEDLGTVSQQWLAEQRATERHYPLR